MKCRPATEDDIDEIRRVAESSWEADYPDVLSRETIHDGVEQWYSQAVISMELQSPRTELLVAEDDGDIIGFVHGHWAGNAGIILRLYVQPEERGRGIGTDLFEAVVSAFRDHDVDQLRAMALSDNETATAFFEDQGMVQVGTETTAIAGDQYEEAVFEYRD